MIHLKNINLAFSKEIIAGGEISIKKGCLTVIKGESGCGKTSLLYMLGLISSKCKCDYWLDEKKIDLYDAGICNEVRRQQFAFVFQDNVLLNNLTVEENLKYFALSSGNEIDNLLISGIIKKVNLPKELLVKYPKQLSGGEQQRVALACALVKNPEYYFVDEPTASLDEKSAFLVLEVLKRETENGKGVIVCTHDSRIERYADDIFEINDRKIVQVRQSEKKETTTQNQISRKKTIWSFSDCWSNVRRSNNKKGSLRKLIIAFCATSITCLFLVSGVMAYLQKSQNSLVNQISDKEIFLINKNNTDANVIYQDGNPVIEKASFDSIEKSNGVESCYYYYEWQSYNVSLGITDFESKIVKKVNEEETQYVFSMTNGDVDRVNYFTAPYVDEMNLANNVLYYLDSESNVYISSSLAKQLEIDAGSKKCSLTIETYIPLKKYVITEHIEENVSLGYYDICQKTTITVSVGGVLKEEYTNRYSASGYNTIYMPYEEMNDIMLDVAETYIPCFDFSDYDGYELVDWMPSACLIFAESYRIVPVIVGKIENVESGFVTKCDYKDYEKIDDLIKTVEKVSTTVSLIAFIMVFGLMFALFVSYSSTKKVEFALLKANGMRNKELLKLNLTDGFLYVIRLSIVTLIMCGISFVFGNNILVKGAFEGNVGIVLFSPLICFVLVMLPMCICTLFTINIKPDEVLRY